MVDVIDTRVEKLTKDFCEKFKRLRAEIEAATPLRRVGSADEMVGPALFLASDDSSFMTGHLLLVDGGNTAQ